MAMTGMEMEMEKFENNDWLEIILKMPCFYFMTNFMLGLLQLLSFIRMNKNLHLMFIMWMNFLNRECKLTKNIQMYHGC